MAPFPSATSAYHSDSYPSISPSRPELSAKGKNVIITGGGTGIGRETARAFAQAGAAHIAVLGRREKPLLDTKASIEREFAGAKVFVASTDVTNKSQVDSAFATFAGNGKIDVVVSNAATTGPTDPIKDVDPEKFLDAIQINLRGSVYVAQAFLRHAASNAVAIDVNSNAAHLNYGGIFASYSISKLAVFRLWDSVASASPELRVFHIQPGVVDTDMNREVGGVKAVGHEDHVSLPAHFNVWLASPEAVFLRNKFLWTNWDVDELKSRAKEIETSTEFNIDLVGWPFNDSSWKAEWNADR